MYKPAKQELPDVAAQKISAHTQTINWVGMGELHFPLHFQDGSVNERVPARAEAFVNLIDPGVRGIHMSRLYLLVDRLRGCSKPELRHLLEQFIATHSDISDQGRICLHFDLQLQRRALVSDNSGWRSYPVGLEATLGPDGLHLQMHVEIAYSSTCPCSKALAEQIVVNKFDQDMGNCGDLSVEQVRAWLEKNAIYASPHSQRSTAKVSVSVDEAGGWQLTDLIDLIEAKLQTAVQSAVKREDEQHFALLNGQNPMFCEDAVRIIKQALLNSYARFHIRVDHYESLHAHNAVAVCSYP